MKPVLIGSGIAFSGWLGFLWCNAYANDFTLIEWVTPMNLGVGVFFSVVVGTLLYFSKWRS